MKGHYEPFTAEGRQRPQHLCASISFFCASLLVLMGSYAIASRPRCSEARAWKVLNMPSPITDSLDIAKQPTMMRGELGQADDIWSMQPSAEVDRAWSRMNAQNMAWATSQDLLAAGKNLSVSVKFPVDAGYGDDAYPILVDIKHKTHCLNRIRMDLNFDHYWKDAYPDGVMSDLHREHTNHCVSILLKSLLCDATTDFITYAWYHDYEHPHPDFNFERKCGDFDGVQQWTDSRWIRDFDDIFFIPKPEGHPSLTMTPAALNALRQPQG